MNSIYAGFFPLAMAFGTFFSLLDDGKDVIWRLATVFPCLVCIVVIILWFTSFKNMDNPVYLISKDKKDQVREYLSGY